MDVVGLLTIAVGLVLIYLGVHGDSRLLPIYPVGIYQSYYGQPATTARNPT